MAENLAIPTPSNARPRLKFHKRRTAFASDLAQRQGDISQLAFLMMGGRDPAMDFLNSECPALGGRPLAIATASADGYEKIARAIKVRAADRTFA